MERLSLHAVYYAKNKTSECIDLFLPYFPLAAAIIQLHIVFYTFKHQRARLVCGCIKM